MRASSTTSGKLSAVSGEDEFLAAVVVYHLLAEGVIARTAQNLAANQYEKLSFPGLAEGQRLVARDEAAAHRHRRLLRPPPHGGRRPSGRARSSRS